MIDPSLASLGTLLPILRRPTGLTESDHAQDTHQQLAG